LRWHHDRSRKLVALGSGPKQQRPPSRVSIGYPENCFVLSALSFHMLTHKYTCQLQFNNETKVVVFVKSFILPLIF
jgi:hypothetical protein